MIRVKNIAVSLALVFIFASKINAVENQPFHWQIGQELTYKVKYTFIRLGTLRLVVQDTTTVNGNLLYHTKLHVDSNPMIFFVNMHNVYESYIDEQMRVHLFIADEKIDDVPYKAEYVFDYKDSLIYQNYTSMKNPDESIVRQVPLDGKIMDGANLIFYARYRSHEVSRDTVVSIYEADKGSVYINFNGEHEKEIKIGAVDAPQKTYFVDGSVDMKALAGLTGPFEGWFSQDSSRAPLKAKLKVFIGHVTLELESWVNWIPPILK
jgi:hypothetical protein